MREGSALKSLLLVAIIAGGAATLVSASWEFSRERIAANRRARLLENVYSVLAPELVGEDLTPILLEAESPDLLGSDEPIEIFVPLRGAEPVAAVFATVAPGGYNAPIDLLVGISAENSTLTGVRVVSHRETPGLGDLIDIRKSDWIRQFDGASLERPARDRWAVDKDGGAFDSITGATVTPRAIVEAVRNTLLYFEANKARIFEEARARVDRGEPQDTEGTARQ